jgi:hypothetical protein
MSLYSLENYSVENIANRLTIEEHRNKRFVFVDYKGLREKEMIELENLHLALTLRDKLPFLADYHNTYITSGYLCHGKRFIELTKGVIDKGAFIGVDQIKSWILKGILLEYNVNYKSFENKELAIDFLTNTNDHK